ncbi:DmsC/YnfH family molybdoenzyme membrane anchor subunit [Azospirillum sp. TSO22-1]|uniref:dimethyl sulfoxide reductase anchor subunit family protein n=1 Tax=Azospirillum sp. TSO22-1 TaxID=716789 RepID=UPI000D60F62C|nr:DmsC/YnfH family molybdoenzyme membrane anchor subunit [Azospirillum sp. TSO22-1]PWC38630.1 DMSO reductase [Azospirillum sp. TSO22-1]
MHPAYSVIFFTTASGAGYGLLALLGVLTPFGLLPPGAWFTLTALALALTLVTGGLLSSTLHLTHPERAWRAVSQWRSSWLSREGVLALAAYAPAGLFGLAVLLGAPRGLVAVLGIASALLALATVYATSMIYASLRAVRQWNSRWVPPVYLVLALMTGALLLAALQGLWGGGWRGLGGLAVGLSAAGWLVKAAYWRAIDAQAPRRDVGGATGLDRLGRVHLLEKPHTEENFLMRELGYQVARAHAAKLRRIAHAALFALPLLLSLAALALPALAVLAVPSAAVGVLAERWLFFAEARHTAMLYYGAAA